MAFGGLKGTLTGNANNIGTSLAISTGGPITVAVGDLIYAVIAEQATASVTACGDNLHGGSTYAATSAAADAGTICTGRCYWKLVTTAGSLSSVTFVTGSSTDNVVAIAAVIEGPFTSSPLDANPANTTNDNTTPYTCPATGTLAQADEVVMCWIVHNGAPAFTATSPNLEVLEAPTQTILTLGVGRQTVAATTTVTPAWTSTLTPSQSCYGTTSYKKDLGAAVGSASGTGAATATGQPLRHTVGSAAGTGAAAAVGEIVTATVIAVSWLRVTGTISTENVGSASGVGAALAAATAITARAGSSAGTGAATATGTGIVARAGSAAGVGAATATGTGIVTRVGSAAGIGAATGTGQRILAAVGSAAGTGAATAAGTAVTAIAGAAAGIGAAAAASVAITARAGSAAGAGAATATSVSIFAAAGSATGIGAAAAVGESVIAVTEAVGSAAGTGAATATATAITASIGSASGIGAASSQTGTVGSAAGIGTAAATATAIHARAGSAAGTGAAAAILGSAGTAAGTGAATAASATIRATAGSAAGVGAATGGVGILAVASGTGAATGTITAVQAIVGSAAGTGAVSGVGAYTRAAVGSAAGSGVATALSAVGTVIGNAAGIGTAAAVGRSTNAVAGAAAGIGTASAVSAALTLITGYAESSITEALLHLDGVAASTTILDTTGKHTWTAVGNAQLDTAQSKFGSASAIFDGAGDYLQCDGNVALRGDFTIDFWVQCSGYDNLTNWPDLTNRPTFSGSTLSWIGPVGGGASTSTDTAQTQVLTNSGGFSTSSNGQVIQNLNVSGLTINHINVIVRRCRIVVSHGSQCVTVGAGGSGLLIEDCELDGSGSTGYGINDRAGASGNTYRRLNVHGQENNIDPSSGSVIRDCYLWDMTNTDSGDPHYDNIEFDSGNGLTIEHNQIWNQEGQNSAVVIDNFFGPLSNVLINNNIIRGGNYAIWLDASFGGGAVSNITITNNFIEEGTNGSSEPSPPTGGGGYYLFDSHTPTHTGNVDWITLASVD